MSNIANDLSQLLDSYKNSKSILYDIRRKLIADIEQHTQLSYDELKLPTNIKVYKQSQEELVQTYNELKIVNSMISDLEYPIEWMETGRTPGLRRGIERRSVYQNTVFMDPIKLQYFVNNQQSRSVSTLTELDKFKIEQALRKLSPNEYKVFLMAHGEARSHSQIANELGVAKSTVDTMIIRAKAKVEHELKTNVFLQ